MELEDINMPSDWKSERLGTAYRFTSKPRDVRYSEFERIPFIPMNFIPQGGATQPAFIEKSPTEISSGTYFEKGDLLLSKITPSFENGKQAIASNLPLPFGIATTEVIPIQCVEDVSDIHFLFYYLLKADVRKAIAAKMEGSTGRQRVPDHVVREWEMPLPPLSEQRQIAAVLWRVQQAVETEAAIVRNARDLKKSLLCRLFTHGLRGESLKETELGPLPESWDVVLLAEIREFLQYGTSERCELAAKGLPVLRIPNVIGGKIDTSELKHANLPDSVVENLRLADGDLVFVRTNGQREYVGRCAVYKGQPESALFASYLIRARPLKDRVNPDFLQAYTMTDTGKSFLSGRSHGAADGKFNINTETINNVLVPLPSLDEQDEIAGILQTVDEKIAVHEAKQRALQDLFKTLLQQLMTAQIRVNHLVLDTREVEGLAACQIV